MAKKRSILGITSPDDSKWQQRDAVDTILKYEELKDNKKLFRNATSRLQRAARSCGGMRPSSR